jgi:hypothetical protein
VSITPNILDLVVRQLQQTGVVTSELKEFAVAVKAAEVQAWNALADAQDNLTEAFQRGKAHALCDVLGDQSRLEWLRVFDQEGTT